MRRHNEAAVICAPLAPRLPHALRPQLRLGLFHLPQCCGSRPPSTQSGSTSGRQPTMGGEQAGPGAASAAASAAMIYAPCSSAAATAQLSGVGVAVPGAVVAALSCCGAASWLGCRHSCSQRHCSEAPELPLSDEAELQRLQAVVRTAFSADDWLTQIRRGSLASSARCSPAAMGGPHLMSGEQILSCSSKGGQG